MTYQQSMDYLFTQLPMFQRVGAAAYKSNLDSTLALCRMLGNPEKKFPSIHIAGTNGKGSTANILASVFQEHGYKTGLYTSPHLVDFRERIRINGQMVSEDFVVDFVDIYKDKFSKIGPSFFEITFAMAVEYFAQQEVDIVIMETGMGGRLDSTNVVNSILSIITNIGLDHTAFLGNTIAEIAVEKAGIIKKNIPVIIGERQEETTPVFMKFANKNNAPLYYAGDIAKLFYNTENYMAVVNEELFEEIEFPLKANYQSYNLRTALAALVHLSEKWQLSQELILSGVANTIKNTDFAGRWQIVSQNPKIILDTGHNVDGLTYSMEQLTQEKFEKLHFILGMVNDKDIESVLALLPRDAVYYFCKADIPRGLDASILAQKANMQSLNGEIYKSINLAFVAAKKNAQKQDLIFVGGSTFTVAEVLPLV